jgi:uncharacterized membrane protein YqaE (UPF0057 family)
VVWEAGGLESGTEKLNIFLFILGFVPLRIRGVGELTGLGVP